MIPFMFGNGEPGEGDLGCPSDQRTLLAFWACGLETLSALHGTRLSLTMKNHTPSKEKNAEAPLLRHPGG